MKFIYGLIVLVSFSGLGYLAGKGQGFREGVAQAPKPEMPVISMNPEDEKNWKELKEKLQGVTPDQIREYLRTQNADEKLKKADEILGKILQAMVATIGYRLQPEELAQLNGSPSVRRDTQPIPVEPIVESKTDPKKAEKDLERNYQKLKRQIQNVDSEDEAQKVLADLPTEINTRIKSATSLSQQQINQLRGHFEGTLTYLKDASVVRTTLEFSGQKVGENKVTGQAVLVVYNKSGRAVSTGTSNGDLDGRYSSTPVSVLIESGGDYFELIYFRNLDAWMGNFYEMQKGQQVKAGTLVYRR